MDHVAMINAYRVEFPSPVKFGMSYKGNMCQSFMDLISSTLCNLFESYP